ncbi:D-glycero-beta-D-manno-heptose 1,7-bisphosphate 7-phosphatase [Acetivibrio cellulolyticus]|uniref:D-glycero-beta-D-manno-heptose 1,7-bisphosphate 7-phosphatase n=1 Tax=Acetivibrio cellulolyticus TaxID=35830 RepID=UPI0001E2F10C|nr:D-glycero-beta-D-manno-heptose 1,7-bisphosphate 7-phosphatase [Acetivibrio cellulolyticus]
MAKAVFLDRDGTINVEKNYVYKIEDFEFIDGTKEAIKRLNDNDYKVIVITNQAGIARGYYKEEDVFKLHNFMNKELSKIGAQVDAFYYCPHHPTAGDEKYRIECNCRKPKSGLIVKAVKDFELDLSKCWLIGDKESDIIAGQRVGIKTILVRTGYGSTVDNCKTIQCESLIESVDYILNYCF